MATAANNVREIYRIVAGITTQPIPLVVLPAQKSISPKAAASIRSLRSQLQSIIYCDVRSRCSNICGYTSVKSRLVSVNGCVVLAGGDAAALPPNEMHAGMASANTSNGMRTDFFVLFRLENYLMRAAGRCGEGALPAGVVESRRWAL
jgi:hypothetical protein